MGNEALEKAKPAVDKTHGHDDTTAVSPLRAQVDGALASPPKPTDKAEKTIEVPQPTGDAADPYTHTNKIKALSSQLDQLTADGKKPNDIITVDDKQVKVSDFVKQAKEIIKSELEQAKTAVKGIKQESVGVMINQNAQDKITLSQQLGLDPKTITPQLLQAERAKSANNPSRTQIIDALDGNLQERAAMEALRHAPAYIKMVESEVTAKGHARPELALGKEVSADDTRKAFELLKLAGNEDPELKASDLYAKSELIVGMTFASFQQERSAKIIELMRSATEAGKKGEPQTVTIDGKTQTLNQEQLLIEANKLADKINIPWIASQAMLPANEANGASTELRNIISIASFARLDYVHYMADHGQMKEAQVLFTKVKTDSPQLIYKENGEYREDSLKTLDNKLTLGVNTDGADYQLAQSNFLHLIEKGKLNPDPKHPGQSAAECLDQMKAFNQQFKKEMEEANKPLLAEKQELLKRQQEMEKRGNRSDAEKVELEELKRQIKVIDGTLDQRTAYFNRRDNLTTYLEGSWLEAKEDITAANQKYSQFAAKETDPTLKKNLEIDEKIKRTEDSWSGWWHRNWGYFAVGASIVVAAGLTVATLGVGSAVGAGLVATAITAVGVGTAGGAAAHWAVERTVNENAGWESAWKGAKIGLATSSMIVAPWATAGRAAAVGGATELAAGTQVASNATAIGRLLGVARTVGITKTSLAAGYTTAAITEGGDYAFGYKTGGEAATSFVKGGLFNSMLIGQAGKWGQFSEAAVAANTTKFSLTNAIGLTGKNALAGYSVSGVMEGYNYFSGQKSGGEAIKDFAAGGAVNTVTLSVLRKYGLSNEVGKAATANMQNLRYAGQTILLNESFGAASDIVGTKYLAHDILGAPAYVSEGGNRTTNFFSPMVADLYNRKFGDGLNVLHPGDRKRFSSNLDALGNDMTSVIAVDQKFITPQIINQTGVVDQPPADQQK